MMGLPDGLLFPDLDSFRCACCWSVQVLLRREVLAYLELCSVEDCHLIPVLNFCRQCSSSEWKSFPGSCQVACHWRERAEWGQEEGWTMELGVSLQVKESLLPSDDDGAQRAVVMTAKVYGSHHCVSSSRDKNWEGFFFLQKKKV